MKIFKISTSLKSVKNFEGNVKKFEKFSEII